MKEYKKLLLSNKAWASERLELDPSYFGEGITVFKDKIYQLTWLHLANG